jgi:hypothetical protein
LRLPLAQAAGGWHLPPRSRAEVAQLVEQLIRNQQVTGSSPVFGSLLNNGFGRYEENMLGHFLATYLEHAIDIGAESAACANTSIHGAKGSIFGAPWSLDGTAPKAKSSPGSLCGD